MQSGGWASARQQEPRSSARGMHALRSRAPVPAAAVPGAGDRRCTQQPALNPPPNLARSPCPPVAQRARARRPRTRTRARQVRRRLRGLVQGRAGAATLPMMGAAACTQTQTSSSGHHLPWLITTSAQLLLLGRRDESEEKWVPATKLGRLVQQVGGRGRGPGEARQAAGDGSGPAIQHAWHARRMVAALLPARGDGAPATMAHAAAPRVRPHPPCHPCRPRLPSSVCLLQGKIKSLESVFLFSLPVKEYQVGRWGLLVLEGWACSPTAAFLRQGGHRRCMESGISAATACAHGLPHAGM